MKIIIYLILVSKSSGIIRVYKIGKGGGESENMRHSANTQVQSLKVRYHPNEKE